MTAIQALSAALAAALQADANPDRWVAFGDGVKPQTATSRYIVAWIDAGTVDDASLRSRDGLSGVGTFHCYGNRPETARFAYDALTAAVLGLAGQEVGGRVLWMPEQLTALPLSRDDSLNPPLFDAICEWRFRFCPV